jgi:hypothetical protein
MIIEKDGKKLSVLNRVLYAKKGISKEKREYFMIDVGIFPVGFISEYKKMADKKVIDGFLLIDEIEGDEVVLL